MSPAVPAALLVGSGVSALIYQTIWVKQLALVVGVDVYAITTAVSAFFAGLALGGAIAGPWADRSTRPLALYARLEIGVALLGVGATLALGRAAPLFVSLQSSVGPLAWAMPFVLIGAPALLMGGTLPALVRALEPAQTALGRTSGRLYAANTLGGILGTLATPFLLVPLLGVRGTAAAAGLLNLVLALAAFAASRPRAARPPAATAAPLARDAMAALVLYAIAGGLALGYEVVWTQTIVQFINTRAYAFAIVLATYLTGLVVGSALYARIADRVERPWLTFGVLEAAAGIAALATFAGLGPWLPRWQETVGAAVLQATQSVGLATCARFALAAAVVVFVPTLLLGAAFPAAVRLVAGAAHVGRDVGTVTALNTAGGIAGTFLTGFVGIPLLGLARTLGVLAVAAVGVGAIALVRGSGPRWRPAALVASALVAVVAAAALAVPREKLQRLLVATRGGTLDFYEESPGGTVAVLEEPHFASSFRRLYIQGVSNSGDAMMSLRYMRLQALLPLIVQEREPRSALVVGLGTGITCGTLLAYPTLERRVCVELLPAVVRAVPRFRGNYGVTSDPRISLRISDGRHELLRSAERYDLITLEPPPPVASGVVNLYSRDFYELCRERLAPGGSMAQWWPLATQNDEDSRSLVRSLLDVFPHVTLWTTELHEMLVVGSMEPVPLDAKRIRRRFEQATVAEALHAGGVASPAALLATYVTDRAGLEGYAGDAPPVTDDRPLIEHAGWMRGGEFVRVLPRIMSFRRPVPLVNGDPAFEQAIETERRRLMTFYQASLHHYAKEPAKSGPLLERVLAEDPENPYYRWFVGR